MGEHFRFSVSSECNKMKETLYILSLSIILCLVIFLQGDVAAVTWQDEFDLETQENWQLRGDDSTWRTEYGFLRAKIDTQKQWKTIFEVFEYVNHPGHFSNITIKAENIGASGDVKFGIAIGKRFLNDNAELVETGYYLFLTNDMQALRDGKVFLGTGRRWNTDALDQMTLHFNEGRFQFSGNDESRIDFIDANLKTIDFFGFVLVGYVTDMPNTGEGYVERVTISGLPVTAEDKLTTTWGQLKQD